MFLVITTVTFAPPNAKNKYGRILNGETNNFKAKRKIRNYSCAQESMEKMKHQ
jgi:hypothetical protein